MSDDAQHKVSPNNPCPFLRMLVAQGLLDDRVATIGDATAVIERVAATGDDSETSLTDLLEQLKSVISNYLENLDDTGEEQTVLLTA